MRLFREQFLFIPLIGFLLLFGGCKKKELSYTISGRVYDISSDHVLFGAKVKIYSSGAGSDNFSTTQTTATGGTYSYTFPRKNYTDITIEVSKDGYFSQEQTFIIDDLEINNENEFNFDLESKAWVKLHFVGDGTKDVKFGRIEGYGGCDECCDGTEQIISDVLDQEILCINKGNQNYKIYYQVLGVSTIYTAEVITVPFEYTELLINIP
jgi:hypothetical protein